MSGIESDLLTDSEVQYSPGITATDLICTYGVLQWTHLRELSMVRRMKERITKNRCWYLCAILQALLAFGGAVTLTFYLLCYLPRGDHILRFLSYLCYWLAVTSTPIICVFAMWMNKNIESPSDSWIKVLNKSDFSAKMKKLNDSKKSSKLMLVICIAMPAVHFILKIYLVTQQQKECRKFTLFGGLFADALGGFYFSLFWYFLSLQRIALEGATKLALDTIDGAIESYNDCIHEVKELFQQYYPLRLFMVRYSYTLVFSSLVGFGVVFTWNYGALDTPAPVTETPQVNITFREGLCPYECDTARFIHENGVLPVYNGWVLWRHLMIALLPLCASKGMDIKFIWEDFKKALCLKYTQDNREYLRQVIKFTDEIHPKISFTAVLNLLMLVVTLATWMLGNQTRNF